jgi:hypothetical protein
MIQVVTLVCDADFVLTHDWAMKFRDKKIEEMIKRYKQSDDYTISDLRKDVAIKTAPNHGLRQLHDRG